MSARRGACGAGSPALEGNYKPRFCDARFYDHLHIGELGLNKCCGFVLFEGQFGVCM